MPVRANTPARREFTADPAVRAVLRDWRALTGGRRVRDPQRRTLLAVSGGADSAAMLVAFSSRPREVVVAHVIHDMRPRAEALADRDFVRNLADRFGLEFCEASIRPRRTAGNTEAAARRLRYAALIRLAAKWRCPCIATAHHAGDLAETVIMRLLRGSGPRGLGAIRAARRLDSATLIRPMLSVNRADTERICANAGVVWCVDASNSDTSRLRAAVRHRVMPLLRELAPGVEGRTARTAALCLDAAGLVRDRARRILADATRGRVSISISREAVRGQRAGVVGEAVRLAAAEVSPKGRSIGGRTLTQIVAAARDRTTDHRGFACGAIAVAVTAREVVVSRAPARRGQS